MTTDPTKHPMCGTYEDKYGSRIVICAVSDAEFSGFQCVGFLVYDNGATASGYYWSAEGVNSWTKLSDELHMDPNWQPPGPGTELEVGCYYEILVDGNGPIVALCGISKSKEVVFYPCKGHVEFYSIPFVTVIRGPLVPEWKEATND